MSCSIPPARWRRRVTRAIPLEDGVRLELELDRGRLYAVSPLPAPRVGETVRVRLKGGARFPGGEPVEGRLVSVPRPAPADT